MPHKSSYYRSAPKKKSGKTLWIAIALILVIVVAAGVYGVMSLSKPSTSNQLTGSTTVLLQTSVGNITIQLRTDKPITSANFRNLVEEGKYDGTTFHRTMAGFMIQGGQINQTVPAINDEIGSNNRNVAYTIAMAKTSAPNSATSEFFINVVDNGPNVVDQAGHTFDQTYTQFGTVIDGKNVVDAIANAPATANPDNPSEISLPVNPVVIIHASVLS